MDGILVVDKPQAMTSHDVVDFIRRRFGIKKAGHAGSLDPMATGVLVILVGRLTKSSSSFSNDDKEYEAKMVLGGRSDTGDAWGKVSISNTRIDLERPDVENAFKKFLGHIEQIPPMYSAVKMSGRRLYRLARKGVNVERDARKVFIKKLEIIDVSLPEIHFKVLSSKGTYIRQLCADIGERIGCGAYMSYLRRMRSGDFTLDSALKFDDLKKMDPEHLSNRLLHRCG